MHTQAKNIIKELYLSYGKDIIFVYHEFGEKKTADDTSSGACVGCQGPEPVSGAKDKQMTLPGLYMYRVY